MTDHSILLSRRVLSGERLSRLNDKDDQIMTAMGKIVLSKDKAGADGEVRRPLARS